MIVKLKFLFLCDSFWPSSKLENQTVNATPVILLACTVHSYLNKFSLKGPVTKKKPYNSKTNQLKIPKSAKELVNRNVHQWKMVIWLDETIYNTIVSYGVVYCLEKA